MKVCVQGLWHLGSVTSAGLAKLGHEVIGLDSNEKTIALLNEGKAPIFEPGLDALLQDGLTQKRLHFTTDPHLISDAKIHWINFDTPVDDHDQANIQYVLEQIYTVLPVLNDQAVILISSQMPVGTVGFIEAYVRTHLPTKKFHFAYAPENLRLGQALNVFLNPDRIIVGVRSNQAIPLLEELLLPITDKIEWMSIESAEMTKHAINAFLATSVAFANEIASLCELVGADAKEVERGLKTEHRIGPKAYLSPGGPFAGGTLARDVAYLTQISQDKQIVTPLLASIRDSNNEHKNWVRRKLQDVVDDLRGVTIAVWGLTYKPGTNTLRRSFAVELCDWLLQQGAVIHVHDPAQPKLPEHWANQVICHSTAVAATAQAKVLIIGTEWPDFRQEAFNLGTTNRSDLIIIDANRHIQKAATALQLPYIAVGTPLECNLL